MYVLEPLPAWVRMARGETASTQERDAASACVDELNGLVWLQVGRLRRLFRLFRFEFLAAVDEASVRLPQ